MIRSLDRKRLPYLSHLKGQVVTVALVVTSGIAGYVGFLSLRRERE